MYNHNHCINVIRSNLALSTNILQIPSAYIIHLKIHSSFKKNKSKQIHLHQKANQPTNQPTSNTLAKAQGRIRIALHVRGLTLVVHVLHLGHGSHRALDGQADLGHHLRVLGGGAGWTPNKGEVEKASFNTTKNRFVGSKK